MTTTIFLKFPDQSTFLSLMPSDFIPHGETGFPLPEGVLALSIIGEVEGLTGYHVNALDSIPSEWTPYIVDPMPVTPFRVFGGGG